MSKIIFGDNLDVLATVPDEYANLIYIDPPFNTGRRQTRTSIKTVRDEKGGDRTGYKGKRYRTITLGETGYHDKFDDYLSFLEPRFIQAKRILKSDGSLFLHIDYREVHYCKVLLDQIFGRASFINANYLGVRLRRPLQASLVCQTRQHPVVRKGPEELHLSI